MNRACNFGVLGEYINPTLLSINHPGPHPPPISLPCKQQEMLYKCFPPFTASSLPTCYSDPKIMSTIANAIRERGKKEKEKKREKDRIEREKAEKEKERIKMEMERIKMEWIRMEWIETEKAEMERVEMERVEKGKKEREKMMRRKAERGKMERERIERERIEEIIAKGIIVKEKLKQIASPTGSRTGRIIRTWRTKHLGTFGGRNHVSSFAA